MRTSSSWWELTNYRENRDRAVRRQHPEEAAVMQNTTQLMPAVKRDSRPRLVAIEGISSFVERHEKLFVAGCMTFYVVLAVCLANVRPPQSDEGHFADGAVHIATTGRFIMPTWTDWLPTLNQRVYAAMPLYFYGLAGWFRVFGVGMLSMRYFSVFWGAILVLAYYLLVRTITANRVIAWVTLLVMVFNYDLINLTTSRYDDMAAALGAAGLALYALLRERHLAVAILTANACIAAAAMTHPYGSFALASFIILLLTLERNPLRVNHIALAALPYVIALTCWGLYISRDVAMFTVQFRTNAAAHKSSLLAPFSLIRGELHDRYWILFAGERAGVPVYMRLKLGLLLLYAVSFGGFLLAPKIREDKAARALIACAMVGFVALMLGDGSHLYIYFVHVIGLYSIVVGIWLTHMVSTGHWQRSVSVAILCGLAAFTVASVAYRMRVNSYENAFLKAADYISKHVTDKQLVFAGGEFAFAASFDRHLVDDPQLGYRNHKRPDYIVVGKQYDAKFRREKEERPEVYSYVTRTLREYRVVFASKAGLDYYLVYGSSEPVMEKGSAEPKAQTIR
jgi:4-amino-4-deoxy-L-arabinose transferase-like glycosyltransferase